MSDSQAVTIPAAGHTATAETRPVRLLTALAQNPEPLSTPDLASLLADPGQRRRLLASYDRTLRRHEQAGHVEQAGHATNGPRPARHHLAHHHRRSRLARRTRQSTSPRRGHRRRSTTQNRTGSAHGHRAGPRTRRSPRHLRPPDSADHPQTRCSPAKGTRLHPRPDRRGLPRQQGEDPPGPPLGPAGPPGGTQTPEKAVTPGKRRRSRRRCGPGCRGSDRSGGWGGDHCGRHSRAGPARGHRRLGRR